MSTGYISSDFMEIRQHLAHYIGTKEQRKISNYNSTYAGAQYDSGARKALKKQDDEVRSIMAKGVHGMSAKATKAFERMQQSGKLAYQAYLLYKQNGFGNVQGARGERNQQDPKKFIKAYEDFYKNLESYSTIIDNLPESTQNSIVNAADRATIGFTGKHSNDAALRGVLGIDGTAITAMDDLYERLKKLHIPSNHSKPTSSSESQNTNNVHGTQAYRRGSEYDHIRDSFNAAAKATEKLADKRRRR